MHPFFNVSIESLSSKLNRAQRNNISNKKKSHLKKHLSKRNRFHGSSYRQKWQTRKRRMRKKKIIKLTIFRLFKIFCLFSCAFRCVSNSLNDDFSEMLNGCARLLAHSIIRLIYVNISLKRV